MHWALGHLRTSAMLIKWHYTLIREARFMYTQETETLGGHLALSPHCPTQLGNELAGQKTPKMTTEMTKPSKNPCS